MKNDFPERKKLRLECYNYSSDGAYFVTIRIKNPAIRLSEIKIPSSPSIVSTSVGDGALDVPKHGALDVPKHGAPDVPQHSTHNVSQHAKPQVYLTETGKIIEKHLLASERIPGIHIDQYVIMPDHLHVIVIIAESAGTSEAPHFGTSRAPSPTGVGSDDVKFSEVYTNTAGSSGNNRANEMLPKVIRAFKRFCNREIGCDIFQRSYIEHIIRDKEDYLIRKKYMHENPARWFYKNSAADQ